MPAPYAPIKGAATRFEVPVHLNKILATFHLRNSSPFP